MQNVGNSIRHPRLDNNPLTHSSFVCATKAQTGRPVILSSYHNERRGSDTFDEVKIWEAVRATTAAPTLFPPIEINGETLVGCGAGTNNPIFDVWNEANDIWGDECGLLSEGDVRCIVSIGAGTPAKGSSKSKISKTLRRIRIPFLYLTSSGRRRLRIERALQAMATGAEATAERFESLLAGLFRSGKAFRFNVGNGLDGVKLEGIAGWEELRLYLQQRETTVRLYEAAAKLRGRVSA